VVMCYQSLPPKIHAIWKNPELKLVLAQVETPRFKSWLDWKSFPLRIKHQEVGGMTYAEVLLYVFYRSRFNPEKMKHKPPRMVFSCSKDHHFGREVDSHQSICALKPEVVWLAEVIYHRNGLYPEALVMPPNSCCDLAMLRIAGANVECIRD
jgi:hypothetical protein